MTRSRLLAAALVAILTAGIAVAATRGSGSTRPPGATPTPAVSQAAIARRDDAVRQLLAALAGAVRDHDATAAAGLADPRLPAVGDGLRRLVTNTRALPLATWSWSLAGPVPAGPQVSVPVVLGYRLAGYDDHDVTLSQTIRVAAAGGHDELAGLSGGAALWSYGPVSVLRRHHVLVLGEAGTSATMAQVGDDLAAAIPRVSAVWGTDWPQRVVAQVPATEAQLAAVTDDHGDLSAISALTSTEVADSSNGRVAAGRRVSINPAVWPTLSELGRRLVLTHELTHVASAADTTAVSPTWLVEGFADYVAFLDLPQPVTVIAAEARARLAASGAPAALPSDGAFAGSDPHLAAVYEQSWLACRLLAGLAGTAGLVRLYRLVGSSRATPASALADALHRVLGESTATFTRQWRAYLQRELA